METPAGSINMAMLPFQRILITGARGFVGRHLVAAIDRNMKPPARLFLAGRSNESSAWDAHTNVFFDLEKPESIVSAIKASRPDLIIHLAGQASVGRSTTAAAATWSINFCGSLALARAVADFVPDCTILFTSSVEVYGLTFNHETATEVSSLRPQSAYACSKAAAEQVLAQVLPPSAQLIVVRPSNHSGPGQDESFVIPAFAAQIARIEAGMGAELHVGNLDAERDFLDIRDVIAAYLALLQQAKLLPSRTTFNVASGQPVRVGEILRRLCKLSNTNIPIKQDAHRMRPSEVLRAMIDPSAIKRVVDWAPCYSLDNMLASVLADQRMRVRHI